MRERTITLNGASKTYAMTGWRIGYLAAPAEFVRAVTALKAMVNIQAPTVSQWAAVTALERSARRAWTRCGRSTTRAAAC